MRLALTFPLLLLFANGYAQNKPAFGPSTTLDLRKYTSFDYKEGSKNLRLTIPEGTKVVRGILVVAPFSGGDTRDFHRESWYREFMHRHDFAFLGASWPSGSQAENYKTMQNALKQIAENAKRPELIHVPYAATGFSMGGAFAGRLLLEAPDRVIAVVIVGSRLRLNDVKPTAAHLGVPLVLVNGEFEQGEGVEGGFAADVKPLLAEFRPKGALWGWMTVPGIGHERDGQEVLAMPILEAAVKVRYPADADVLKGPVTLAPVTLESGWVADNTTWKTGLASVTPAKNFKGDLGKSSWLLNEDTAFIYRAYSTTNRPLKITTPRTDRDHVWDAGSSVTITVDDAKFANWKKLELYDGAKKVAELEKGPARFIVKDLQAGFHAFSVLGTDDRGSVWTSDPVLVTVKSGSP